MSEQQQSSPLLSADSGAGQGYEGDTFSPSSEYLPMSDDGRIIAHQPIRSDKIKNFRDISHISKGMKEKVIFRSATPSEATDDDIRLLMQELNIKTIIDFRDAKEASRDPGERAVLSEYNNVNITGDLHDQVLMPFTQDDVAIHSLGLSSRRLVRAPYARKRVMATAVLSQLDISQLCELCIFGSLCMFKRAKRKVMVEFNKMGLLGLYKIILRRSSKQICSVLKLCADARNYPILLHCSHGKDRTGLTVALIQAAVGLSREHIIADYEISDEYASSRQGRERFHREAPDLDLDEWSRARGETLDALFDWICDEYGSVAGYLDHIGFDERWQRALRGALLKDIKEYDAI